MTKTEKSAHNLLLKEYYEKYGGNFETFMKAKTAKTNTDYDKNIGKTHHLNRLELQRLVKKHFPPKVLKQKDYILPGLRNLLEDIRLEVLEKTKRVESVQLPQPSPAVESNNGLLSSIFSLNDLPYQNEAPYPKPVHEYVDNSHDEELQLRKNQERIQKKYVNLVEQWGRYQKKD